MAKLASSPTSAASAVDHRLGDAVELGLVDEPLPGVGRRVGVVADDIDAGGERLLQHRGDGDRVVGGEQDAVDALGDVVVDQGDLVVDVGLDRAVGGRGHVAQLGGGLGDALGGGVEIADADQLRHVDDGDRLAVAVGRVGRLAAVIVDGRRRCPGCRRRRAGWSAGRRRRSRPTGPGEAGRERQRGQHRQGMFAASVFLLLVRVGPIVAEAPRAGRIFIGFRPGERGSRSEW